MKINYIKVNNFKSFDNLKLEFNNYNALIGANASGKSNTISILKFFRDIIVYGWDNALSIHGGIDNIQNLTIKSTKPVEVEFDFKVNIDIPIFGDSEKVTQYYKDNFQQDSTNIGCFMGADHINYKIKLIINKKRVQSIEDELLIDAILFFNKIVKEDNVVNYSIEKETIDDRILDRIQLKIKGSYDIVNKKIGEYKHTLESNRNAKIQFDDIIPTFIERINNPRTSQYGLPCLSYLNFYGISDQVSSICFFDFDPKLPKKGIQFTGKNLLEEDGSNLASILRKILQNPKNRDRFNNYLHDVLPFIGKIKIEISGDKNIIIKLNEKFYNKDYLFAPFISDGTINIIGTIVAIYFDPRKLIVIEEPERNLHPGLIRKLVDMIYDVTNDNIPENRRKQIIISTHNPQLLKYMDVKNIILIKRDKMGFSHANRPFDLNEYKYFLENEIGIDEMFCQSLLEGMK